MADVEDILGPPLLPASPSRKKLPASRAIVWPNDISERTRNEFIAFAKPKRPAKAAQRLAA
jgi:hypothetical protein